MWQRVLERDPGNARAIAALVADPATGDPASMRAALDACVAKEPRSCVCLGRRADLELRLADLSRASADAKAALDARCPLDGPPPRLREVAALAFASSGAAASAAAALDGASDRDSNPKLVYADALVHAQGGDAAGAEALAKKAVDLHAGRDASLLLAQLLIERGANDEARTVLRELVKAKPPDGKALYDLALVEDRAGHYNEAREGYLAALRADPKLADARYNLAYLTLHQGIVGEARHHAQAFVAAFPDDPRGPELLRLTGAAAKEDSR
jgi:tetratricopeptide (TPR) repeat protein